jgi:hypothetical protein
MTVAYLCRMGVVTAFFFGRRGEMNDHAHSTIERPLRRAATGHLILDRASASDTSRKLTIECGYVRLIRGTSRE